MSTSAVASSGLVARPGVTSWLRLGAYWLFTGIIALEMVAGSLWDLMRIEYVRVIFGQLGYPLFLLSILGAWKLPCAVALVLPRLLRLKEWAYAGAVFLYTGAAASHLLAGEGPNRWMGPFVFSLMTLASWALRPASRRLTSGSPPSATSKREWMIAASALAVMVAVALLTVPKGPPPS